MSRWFRHYAGMMRDDKLVRVAIRSGQTIERVCWVWGAILESAAEIDNGGRYDLDAAEAAYFLRADQADVDAITVELAAAKRVAKGRVVNWGNRQFSSDRSKERVAAYRERKRKEENIGNSESPTSNGHVTLHNCYRNSPETETETETEAKIEVSSTNVDVSAEPTKPLTKQEVIDAWQTRMVAAGFPAIAKMTGDRERKLRARLKDSTLDEWQRAMAAMERSAFCRGENDRGWKADFDFLLQPKSFTKLLEGAYDH